MNKTISLKEKIMSNFENALLFKCIVEEGSLTKATLKFDTNTSAVSKRLSKLEKTLGTQLLKRTTRKMTLTEAGQFFYERMKWLHSASIFSASCCS